MGIGFMKRSMIPYATVTVTPPRRAVRHSGGKFIKKKTATVTAVANSGYIFAGWYAGGVLLSGSLTYTFTVSGDITLEARFRTPVTGDPGTTQGFSNYSYSNSNIYTVSAIAPAKTVTLTEIYVYSHRISNDFWWGGTYTVGPGSGNINLPFIRTSGGSAGNHNIAYSFDGRTLSLDSRPVDTTYCDRNFVGRFNF